MADPALRLPPVSQAGDTSEAVFGPAETALMVEALDACWRALAFAHFDDEQEMRATREALAKRILEGVAGGERRVPVLSGAALGALEPRAARAPGGQAWRITRFAS